MALAVSSQCLTGAWLGIAVGCGPAACLAGWLRERRAGCRPLLQPALWPRPRLEAWQPSSKQHRENTTPTRFAGRGGHGELVGGTSVVPLVGIFASSEHHCDVHVRRPYLAISRCSER